MSKFLVCCHEIDDCKFKRSKNLFYATETKYLMTFTEYVQCGGLNEHLVLLSITMLFCSWVLVCAAILPESYLIIIIYDYVSFVMCF